MKGLLLVSVLWLFSCSSSAGQVVTDEAPVAVAEPEPFKAVSPEQQRFYDAYLTLVCRANLDYDAMDDMATIQEPVDFLQDLVNTDDTRQKYYLPLVERQGYKSVKEYLDAHANLKVAAPVFIQNLKMSLPEFLEECQAK
jgi:hypothetical protein